MKDSVLITSMAYLGDEFIAEAAPTAAAPMKRLRRRLAMKWTSMAAGLCAAFLLVRHIVIPYVRYLTLPEPPTYDHALYTAEGIGSLFDTYKLDGVSTSSYTKVYVPSAEYLNISTIPDGEYIDVYERNKNAEPLNEEEFTTFADGVLARFAQAVNISAPTYEVEREEATSYSDASLRASFQREDESLYSFYATQDETDHYFAVYPSSSLGRISLNDVPLAVDQTMTDEEIIASLGDIKIQLFSVFGVTFEDIKIVRHYNDYSEHGATNLYIYFYNAADDPLNEYMGTPLSDYICLDFDNFANYSGDVVSDTVLSKVRVGYYQNRTDDAYAVSKRVRMISLEEAERLLYNGYVFGGHSCPICMSMQSEVDFEGYDLVGLTYIFGHSTYGIPSEGIPFYTFYKKIGKSPNGNLIYAKTYVPAIEVSGYEEYFEEQKATHD